MKRPKYNPIAMSSQVYANKYGKAMKRYEDRKNAKELQERREQKCG